MKKTILLSALAISLTAHANSTSDSVKIELLQKQVRELVSVSQQQKKHIERLQTQFSEGLSSLNKRVGRQGDSLSAQLVANAQTLSTVQSGLTSEIGENQNAVVAMQTRISHTWVWGGIALASVLAIVFGVYFYVRRKDNETSASVIDEVRVSLDSKLLEIAEKQLAIVSESKSVADNAGEVDHSLALKVVDEIVRIELNLSRMDSSIRGYKQLSKAVERIKDNFLANGYEIVDMLGKPYNDGMKVIASFVTDEKLVTDVQIITKVIKPQILFNGKMIQAAQIEVSQSE